MTTVSALDCDDNNAIVTIGNNQTYYRDADGDTYGNPGLSAIFCTQQAGYVLNSQDCDDTNASITTGSIVTYYRDADGDTKGNISVTSNACSQPSGYVTNSTDCNDAVPTIYQNLTCYYDGDNDGYRTTSSSPTCVGANCTSSITSYKRASTALVDCNDSDPTKDTYVQDCDTCCTQNQWCAGGTCIQSTCAQGPFSGCTSYTVTNGCTCKYCPIYYNCNCVDVCQ